MSGFILRFCVVQPCAYRLLLGQYRMTAATRKVSTTATVHVGYQIKHNLTDCYNLLNVEEDCSLEELKEAYFKMAKIYHPDSQTSTADPKKFDQIKQAYKTIKTHKKTSDEGTMIQYDDGDDDDDDFGFKAHQAQHRQFLDNDGFGVGSRADRQKQYDQMKVSRAQHNIYKYKVKKIIAEGEANAVVEKEKKIAKKNKMSNSMDRLVEDMIQQAMTKGDFDNLTGTGKPLDHSKSSPYMDKVTEKMNQVLMENDFQPDWIMIQKEIRVDLDRCRENLALERKRLGEPPYEDKDLKAWNTYIENFRINIETINEKIHRFNLVVPMLHRQLMPYSYTKELDRVVENYEDYLPHDYDAVLKFREKSNQGKPPSSNIENVKFGDIWREVRSLFRKGENI